MNRFKKWLIPIAIVCLLLASLIGCSSTPASLGETFDPSGNPFANRFSDEKDIRGPTFVIAASDSEHKYEADYRCDGTRVTGGDQVEINTAIEALIDSVTDEVFNSGALDVWVTLDNNRIQRGEVVTSDGITYTNGVDYEMDYSAGMIMCLSTGGMAGATNFYNDYEYGGGDVKLLDGTFWITTSVLVRSHVGLIGSAGTIIKQQDSIASIDLIRNYDWVDGNDYITFCDLRIDGNKLTQIGGTGRNLILYLVDNFEIRNCYFEQSRNQGLNLSTCNYGTVLDCGAHRNDDYGLYISQGSHIILDNNICLDNAENGIYVASAQYFTVTNNHSQRSGWNGIYIYNSDNGIVSDNLSIENSQSSDVSYSNIYLAGSDYNLVSGNICRQGALTNKPKHGLQLSSNCIKNIVQGNDLYDSGKTTNFLDAGICTIVEDDNRDIEITQVKQLRWVKQTSGGALVAGDVVSLKAVAAGNEVTTPAGVGEVQVFGMLCENIADGAYGYVQVKGGTVLLKATNAVGGNIAIGDLLCTEVGNRAMKAGAGDMAFAIALEVCEAANVTIDALIIVPRMI